MSSVQSSLDRWTWTNQSNIRRRTPYLRSTLRFHLLPVSLLFPVVSYVYSLSLWEGERRTNTTRRREVSVSKGNSEMRMKRIEWWVQRLEGGTRCRRTETKWHNFPVARISSPHRLLTTHFQDTGRHDEIHSFPYREPSHHCIPRSFSLKELYRSFTAYGCTFRLTHDEISDQVVRSVVSLHG